MSPVISVVVPMLNAADHLEVLFTSLLQQDFDQAWEIVAVDNGSLDDTANVARAILGSLLPNNLVRHEVVVAPSRQGYATPRNIGVQSASAPLLAFCDADGAVDDNWLSVIARALEQHPLVGSHKFQTPDVGRRSTESVWSELPVLPALLGVPFAGTAGLGVTRELFDSLGGFDPYFDAGGEDADFSLRARFNLGVIPVLEPNANYWTGIPTRPKKSFIKGYRDGRSVVRLYERHLGQHHEPSSGPLTTLQGLYRVLKRLRHALRQSRQQRVAVAREAGLLIGRAVWSVRLGVRCF